MLLTALKPRNLETPTDEDVVLLSHSATLFVPEYCSNLPAACKTLLLHSRNQIGLLHLGTYKRDCQTIDNQVINCCSNQLQVIRLEVTELVQRGFWSAT